MVIINDIKGIETVARIMDMISNESSKTGKESIISSNSEVKYFKEVLQFLYNPYVKTNVSIKKFGKKVDSIDNELSNILDYINYLSKSTGTNKNIATIKAFVEGVILNTTMRNEAEWLLKGMACKNLKTGITGVTINKALGCDFIPQFNIMLAEKWVDYDKKKGVDKENWRALEGKEVIATLKIDGNRAEVFVNDDGSVLMYSREGNNLEGYVEIEESCKELEKGFVYEGEFLYIDETGKMNANEKFKKTSSIMRSKGEKKGLEFIVFDIIPISEFNSNKVNKERTCSIRKNIAKSYVENIDNPFVRYLEPMFEGVFDKHALDSIADELKLMGEEGLMVQCANSPYEYKRVKHLLKYKSFESCDIRCVGVYEGKSGENIGRLGGIVCEYKGHPVNVGIGFSSDQRDKLWANPSDIVGKIVEIKFFEEFISDEGSYDLRFPSFKDIRDDKTEESYY